MVKVIGILLIITVMVILEVPQLLEKKLIKELLIFFIFLVFGTVLSILLALGVAVPNPIDFLNYVLKPLTKIISK